MMATQRVSRGPGCELIFRVASLASQLVGQLTPTEAVHAACQQLGICLDRVAVDLIIAAQQHHARESGHR